MQIQPSGRVDNLVEFEPAEFFLVEEGEDKAIYWIQKAADQGHKQAKELLEKWEKEN